MADEAPVGRPRVGVIIRAAERLGRVVAALADAAADVLELTEIAHLPSTSTGARIELVLTDHVGPEGETDEALQRLLAHGAPPVLVIAPNRLAGVVTLEAGAVDYVVEPFTPRELRARVLSRSRAASRIGHDRGGLRIDRSARRVSIDGDVVDLTPREYDLLVFFADRPGVVIGREALLDAVWGSSSEWQSTDTVTEHVYRLRRKIEQDARGPRWIVTVRGAGYRFDP